MDGLQAAVLPGISAPSSTYRPGWSCTRPYTSHTVPMQAPPRACQVEGKSSLVSISTVPGPAMRCASGPMRVFWMVASPVAGQCSTASSAAWS
ncbi:Uncharacterised protein [Mycobacteroides abscessus subsp. abscessus]|nr:Uncharacterised protein [Mycobacteroides abscessus subsp. abscessus]